MSGALKLALVGDTGSHRTAESDDPFNCKLARLSVVPNTRYDNDSRRRPPWNDDASDETKAHVVATWLRHVHERQRKRNSLEATQFLGLTPEAHLAVPLAIMHRVVQLLETDHDVRFDSDQPGPDFVVELRSKEKAVVTN